MKITESVTETTDKVVGYKCDLCGSEHRNPSPWGKGSLHQTLDDFCDDTYSKWVDLCERCTSKVFKYIEDQGGKVNSDF